MERHGRREVRLGVGEMSPDSEQPERFLGKYVYLLACREKALTLGLGRLLVS